MHGETVKLTTDFVCCPETRYTSHHGKFSLFRVWSEDGPSEWLWDFEPHTTDNNQNFSHD
jgi:hypothetical protein